MHGDHRGVDAVREITDLIEAQRGYEMNAKVITAADEMLQSGQANDDRCWRLPLFDGYREYLKSDVADLNNSSSNGFAGASVGALFLAGALERIDVRAALAAGLKFNPAMLAGTMASISARRLAAPITLSMCASSAASGPRWRAANSAGFSSSDRGAWAACSMVVVLSAEAGQGGSNGDHRVLSRAS